MTVLFIDLLLIQLRVILLLLRMPSSLSATVVLVLTVVFYSRYWCRFVSCFAYRDKGNFILYILAWHKLPAQDCHG